MDLNAQSVWVVEKGATLRAASSDTLGVSDFRVLYDYKFMPDTLARDNFDEFTTILQISKTGLSSYTDYHHYRRDSISISYTKNGIHPQGRHRTDACRESLSPCPSHF
ncbi:MAG: hypothetical protein MJZ83_11970 [Bacteroidaceae bacterium]|nr:hypothetical protein [Bacteroidaceae bacterium]